MGTRLIFLGLLGSDGGRNVVIPYWIGVAAEGFQEIAPSV